MNLKFNNDDDDSRLARFETGMDVVCMVLPNCRFFNFQVFFFEKSTREANQAYLVINKDEHSIFSH